MLIAKLIAVPAAVFMTAGQFFLTAPRAEAASHPISVVAPLDLIVVRRVSYQDLNLAVPAGQKALHHRVGGAVYSLCDEAIEGDSSMNMTDVLRSRCRNDAWGQANPQISLAVQRAQEIAATGTSSIAAAALVISVSN